MRKLSIALFFILLFFSCGNNKEKLENMTGEMCEALELYSDDDPMSIIEVVSALVKVDEKYKEEKFTTEEISNSLEKKCPDGFQVYKSQILTEEN